MMSFTAGLVIYAIFIWHFHRYVSTRDVFRWDTEKYERSGALGKLGHGIAYLVKYLIAYPVLVFVWFGVFAAFMFVLGGSFQVQTILLVSFALVTAIRICSYYKEELAVELAKIVPFSILAAFVLQPSAFNFDATQKVFELGSFLGDILSFMIFSVFAEWVIRIAWSIKRKLAPHVHPELDIVERFGR
ncbi:MAG: hypothetical protein HY833_01905 [Candidatus Aenigmarchaeota archaeon]|nr:hypothetical protein [Candidatus Aenigmarchaeota archaeon]